MFDEHVFVFVPQRIGISYKAKKDRFHDPSTIADSLFQQAYPEAVKYTLFR